MESVKPKEDHRVKMTTAELKSIEPYPQEHYYDYNFEQKLIQHLFEKIGNPKSEEELFSELTEGQQYFYSNVEFCAQVINGGIAQYFYNSHRKFVQFVIHSFLNIDCNLLANELMSVYDFHVQNKIKFEELRSAGNFSDFYKLMNGDEFDNIFFAELESMEKKMVNYILTNPSDFIKD